MENKQQFTLWYFLGVMVLLFVVQTFFARAHVGTLSYSGFKTLLQAGKVHDVMVGSETIQGTLELDGAEKLLPPAVLETMQTTEAVPPQGAPAKGPGVVPARATHPFIARRVDDPRLTTQLDVAKVRYTAATENRWLSTLLSWVLPMVIFIGAWNFMMRRSGSGHMDSMMEIGQSKAKVVAHITVRRPPPCP
jgi:cell division protease FtsH